MLIDAENLPRFKSLLINSIKLHPKKAIALITVWSAVTCSSSTAAPDINSVKSDPDRVDSSLSSKQELEPAISSGEVRLMNRELRGLLERFKTTLLTADAIESEITASTDDIVRQLLSEPISRNKNFKPAKSNYLASHRALQLAEQGLQRFNYLIERRQYDRARREWFAAKQILWENYPRDRPLAQSEVRGMWLDRGTIVKAKSEADLAKIFDHMATAGINTVFFETLNSSYTIYPSKVAPQQNPLVSGWDPLKAAVKLAHERGMELHAWVWTFAAVNQRHNTILGLPRNYLGPVLSRHPEWGITDQEGSRFHYSSGKVFLDPANPEVRSYLLSLITEIATDYDVDGIHLDYIRYPFQSPTAKMTYGYGMAARKQFQEQTGYDPIELSPDRPLWSEWTEFRIEQVDNFVALVSQSLKQLRPELTLSTAVFPMPPQERLQKIQQHWENWISKEWIDLLIPMTYAQDSERLDSLASPLLDEFDRGKALLLPGIRLLNISDVAALDQMQLLRGMSTEGYALFAAENLNSLLIETFNNTQGIVQSKQLLPHREPFPTALARYQKLRQEWNFFLTNYSVEVDDAIFKKWGKQADRLETELQNLADKPTGRNFFSAQISLRSMRQQFPDWMNQAQGIDPYQVSVWQNRLDSLDRLLSYGARKNSNTF